MVLCLTMNSREDGDAWMEEQWEKWLTQDMSLDEYEDDDLSEVTEISAVNRRHRSQSVNDIQDHVSRPANGLSEQSRRRGALELQKEMLKLDLIDAEGGSQEGEEEEEEEEEKLLMDERRREKRSIITVMDSYRPKRPTTLNLFPQVPRTQDTINNNSLGEKDRRKDRTHSSSARVKGDLPATVKHVGPTDGDKVHANLQPDTKPRVVTASAHTAPALHCKKPKQSPDGANDVQSRGQSDMRDRNGSQSEVIKTSIGKDNGCREQVRRSREKGCSYQKPESVKKGGAGVAQDIHLTPVGPEQDRPFLSQSSDSNRMSISSDTELPPLHFHPSAERPNPSISEEDEVYPPTPPCRTDSLSEAPDLVDKEKSATSRCGHTAESADASGLTYDSVKYTLVVDEHAQLELVSIKQCYQGYDSDSDNTVYESAVDEDDDEDRADDEDEESATRSMNRDTSGLSTDSATDTASDVPRSRKFLNVFINRPPRFPGVESFGLFSCIIDGEEREQSHRAVFRFIPRHEDELEMEADDPLLMEMQAEDLWCEAYNMRTGSRGIFPAFYAVKVLKDNQPKEVKSDWLDTFWVKFLGSVQVPYHKGNDVLCAAMQKIATNRRTMRFHPPSVCIVEISIRGVKIIVQEEGQGSGTGDQYCHFFQLKNVSFCGCHPKNQKYFGLITKHPAHQRFACHVFFSEEHAPHLADSVGKAFQQFYKEHMEFSCPTEDIFLE